MVNYIGYGEEICPKTGKSHLQGWFQLKRKRRLKSAIKLIGAPWVHVEPMRGTPAQSEKYCSKEGKFQSMGAYRQQGQCGQIGQAVSMIKQGCSQQDLDEAVPEAMIRYYKGISQFKARHDRRNIPSFRQLEVWYIWGPTNTNKTRSAMESFPDAFKIHGENLKWFDGYEQEDVLIIDEYCNQVPIATMLGLLDGYPLRLPVKHGHTYAAWTKVVITSNISLEDLHSQAKSEHREALRRRIHHVIHMVPVFGSIPEPVKLKPK